MDQLTGGSTALSEGLEQLLSALEFRRERIVPHVLPGVFLGMSLFVISSIIFTVAFSGLENLEELWYYNLVSLYIVYIMAAAYSSYRFLKTTHRHLVDSGLYSYVAARRLGDLDAIKKLYRGGLAKKELPSPITGLILSIFSLGLAYPIILYVCEKNLRDHIYGEEKTFLGRAGTSRISAEHLFIDLAATFLTLGFYLIYWGFRVVSIYNRHISRMHGGTVAIAEQPYTEPVVETVERSPIFIIVGSLIMGLGITGFLGAMGIKAHLFYAVGIGLLVTYYSIRFSKKSIVGHVFSLLGIIYLFFALGTLLGLIVTPGYVDFLHSIQEQLDRIRTNDLVTLTRNIFFNNLVIALAEVVPLIGPIMLGIGLSNSSIFVGVYLGESLATSGDPSVLFLFIMPHTFLELLAYAVMAAASIRLVRDRESRGMMLVAVGILVLLLAAFVESQTIMFSQSIGSSG